ncbi:heavy-metal-associated domain-containing protein [Pisciglobus halotolerans]|uniref:Copper chaperone CopZ n=1 Tax=Pisciglobus halotolerans TaxID=745365 RepID=A0A1I3ARF4_9LACT|nr:heavy metal-associated domain-containing protein [Pisciglobus halotolerans]SFH51941.1 Copper chaperone CopZ [Pisciglobus halotolerans]
MSKALFQIESLTCAGCASQIEQHMNQLNGIQSIKVFAHLGKVRTVFYETDIKAEQIGEKLGNIGYPVQNIVVSTEGGEKNDQNS